jgi:hypothetical protein
MPTILILSPSKDELQKWINWNSSFDGLRMRIVGRRIEQADSGCSGTINKVK